jgi:hypothetical protein
MTRTEALRAQVEPIMEAFDFERVYTVLKAAPHPASVAVATVEQLRDRARKLLDWIVKDTATEISCGGFVVATHEEEGECGDPAVALMMSFQIAIAETSEPYVVQ